MLILCNACLFVYKCGVSEKRIRSKWILYFPLKTQVSIVSMIFSVGDSQISWAKHQIFVL